MSNPRRATAQSRLVGHGSARPCLGTAHGELHKRSRVFTPCMQGMCCTGTPITSQGRNRDQPATRSGGLQVGLRKDWAVQRELDLAYTVNQTSSRGRVSLSPQCFHLPPTLTRPRWPVDALKRWHASPRFQNMTPGYSWILGRYRQVKAWRSPAYLSNDVRGRASHSATHPDARPW